MKSQRQGAIGSRRTAAEVGRLVRAFQESGLGADEFCRRQGLATSTLRRRLQKQQMELAQGAQSGARLVAVKVAEPPAAAAAPSTAGLEVILRSGRRIGVGTDFDAVTLRRLVGELEGR